jgi:hypothetical protein
MTISTTSARVSTGKRIVLGVALGTAAIAVWLALRHQTPVAAQPGGDAQGLVGKWTFVEGTMKSDWEIQAAGGQTHEVSVAGKSMVVAERDGALWATGEGDPCSIKLVRKPENAGELVGAKTECPEQPVDAGKPSKRKSIQMTMSLDARGRAHVTRTTFLSIEAGGRVHEGRLDVVGLAEKQADPAR